MSYDFYKILHLAAILMIFLSIGGMIALAQAKVAGAAANKMMSMLHGTGLLIALIAGFGIMAKIGLDFDGWVIGKLIIWVVFGGLMVLIKRKPEMSTVWAGLSIALGILATYLAVIKPF
ncbi:hypothetical protein IID10_17410 [candidate division KSB1 bacterium]|nr:hypothetical protein [candidate division KSB1 bacterium]TDI90499.1 MAG: hypothetical protein E2O77_08155 [Caldithrix sp.]